MSNYLNYLDEQFSQGKITHSEKKEGYDEYEKGDFHKKRKLDKDSANIVSNKSIISNAKEIILKKETGKTVEVPKTQNRNTETKRASKSQGRFFKTLGSILYGLGLFIKSSANIVKAILSVLIFFSRKR